MAGIDDFVCKPENRPLWRRSLLERIREYHICAQQCLSYARLALGDEIPVFLQELGGMAGEW